MARTKCKPRCRKYTCCVKKPKPPHNPCRGYIETVEKAIAAFAAGQIALFLSYFAANATLNFHAPNPPVPYGGVYTGITGIETWLGLLAASSSNLVLTLTFISCADSTVVAIATISGNLVCPADPTITQPFSLPFVLVNAINGQGKIQTLDIYTDSGFLVLFYQTCPLTLK